MWGHFKRHDRKARGYKKEEEQGRGTNGHKEKDSGYKKEESYRTGRAGRTRRTRTRRAGRGDVRISGPWSYE